MALVIEDGSGVTGANSYNSVQEIKDFAELRGELLPSTDSEIEMLAINAMDYMEQYRYQYQGSPVDPLQGLSFPRTGVSVDDYAYLPTQIPVLLKKAHILASIQAYTADLNPNPTPSVKKEKVDVIEVEYMDTAMSSTGFPNIESLVYPLLRTRGGLINVVRA